MLGNGSGKVVLQSGFGGVLQVRVRLRRLPRYRLGGIVEPMVPTVQSPSVHGAMSYVSALASCRP